jgi:hypothetical protein
MASTQQLIETAVTRFQKEVPALAKLKLVFELELRGRGDVQMFRVEVPGPKVSKGVAENPRATVTITRAEFNQLATEGTARDYRKAYEHGHIKASGDPNVLKLIGQVVLRHEERARTRKVH